MDTNLDRLAMLWLISSSNPELRHQIELNLIEAAKTNTRFSREYFYAWFTTANKPVQLVFIPGSISFLDFGQNIVVVPRFTDDVIIKLESNIRDKVDTYGLVRAEDVNGALTMEARKKLIVTGFSTNDVMEVRFL